MDRICATVTRVSMELIVKSTNHVDHHLASMVVVASHPEVIHFGNVSVHHYTPVKPPPFKQIFIPMVIFSSSGPRCEIVSLGCFSNPCRTGTCRSLPNGGYQCLCPPLVTGINCEIPLLPCASNPCLNNATCITISLTNYTCICPPLFTGLRCGQQIIVCSNNQCQGNSTCIVNPITGEQICQCPPDRYGIL